MFGRSKLTHNEMTNEEVNSLDEAFAKASRSALTSWKGVYSGEDEDLKNDLWVWYLESPSVRRKLGDSDPALVHTLCRNQALNILAGNSLVDDLDNSSYSSESVKDALLGNSSNKYLLDILPIAMQRLDRRNPRYAESIRSRYEDGITPPQGSEFVRLSRATRSLTGEVNIIVRSAGFKRDDQGNLLDREGPGSRSAVFPETLKPKGLHSDPTGDTAIALMENPQFRDEYLQEDPITEFLTGPRR